MPKARLLFDHFDWTPIGDSETIVVTFAQEASHPWSPIAGGEGKPQTVPESDPSDRASQDAVDAARAVPETVAVIVAVVTAAKSGRVVLEATRS